MGSATPSGHAAHGKRDSCEVIRVVGLGQPCLIGRDEGCYDQNGKQVPVIHLPKFLLKVLCGQLRNCYITALRITAHVIIIPDEKLRLLPFANQVKRAGN